MVQINDFYLMFRKKEAAKVTNFLLTETSELLPAKANIFIK